MDRRPRFNYGTAEVFVATISSPSWSPTDETIGGARIAASGLPATYIVRRDRLVGVTLRFWEDEWPEVLALVTFGQSGAALVWFPDADEATSYNVYLHAPAPGERWGPSRDGNFPRVLELTLTLRSVGGGALWSPYFDEFVVP